MPNLKMFGSQIHDTAIVFIVTSTITSVGYSYFGELGRFEANVILGISGIISLLYWIKEYKK